MRVSAERDTLVGTVTRMVVQELLGVFADPAGQTPVVSGPPDLSLDDRILIAQAVVAARLNLAEAQLHRSTAPGALTPIINPDPDGGVPMEVYVRAALAYAEAAAEIIGERADLSGSGLLAKRVEVAGTALEQGDMDYAVGQIFEFIAESKSWWMGGYGGGFQL